MKRIALFLLLALAAPALAQQPQPPSSGEQALSNELIKQLQATVQASARLIEVQRELEAAKARIKELEPKPDDKK